MTSLSCVGTSIALDAVCIPTALPRCKRHCLRFACGQESWPPGHPKIDISMDITDLDVYIYKLMKKYMHTYTHTYIYVCVNMHDYCCL